MVSKALRLELGQHLPSYRLGQSPKGWPELRFLPVMEPVETSIPDGVGRENERPRTELTLLESP